MPETWKPIPGFPGYDVSDQGQVRSYYKRVGGDAKWELSDTPQRIMAGATDKRGVRLMVMRSAGLSHIRTVHSLVMLSFIGPRPEGLEVCHYDGNPSNNHLDNLQ